MKIFSKKIKSQIKKTNFLLSYLLKKSFSIVETDTQKKFNLFDKLLVNIF